MLERAAKELGAEFDKNTAPKSICVAGNTAIFEVEENLNVVYLDNEYIERENIVKGIWKLFRVLPDEKISLGIMDADKKRKLLGLMRSDKGIDYIRGYFKDRP